VILDRFVLSVLSRIRVDGESGSTFLPHLKDIAVRSTLAATIYCDCSFETAWDRVNAEVRNGGRAALSPKEMKGPIYLRRLHDAIKADFDRLDWIGAKYSIATDRGIETMMDQCGPLFGSLLQARDS
jgi:thymidylate kinase